MTGPPKVFISYSWDNNSHKKWVKKISTRLRADGVEVFLDQWHAAPGDQLPKFMESAVRENDFILIICTPNYKNRSEQRTGGVGFEGDVMTGEVLMKGNHRKFIPILREGSWETATPSWLAGKYGISLKGDPYPEPQYKDLLNTLLRSREQAPPIGKSERKHEVLFIEDRPETIFDLIVYVENKGLNVITASTVYKVQDILTNYNSSIFLIVVDIMLFAVQSLESIGIQASTDGGYNAGLTIIEHLLRPDIKESKYHDIPILICSSRWLSEDNIMWLQHVRKRGGAWIRFLEKGQPDFKEIFKDIVEQAIRYKDSKCESV